MGKAAKGLLPAGAALLLGAGLLLEGAAVAEGVRRGLEICAGVLIPALFPFMALACFLAGSPAARVLSLPLTPLTTRVFKLPGELGALVLLSLIGGYPVGAKMIASLLEQGRIDPATARRMLCFCFGASPSFLISAVGVGMLMSFRTGVVLYAAHLAATLLIGAVVSLRVPVPRGKSAWGHRPGGTALLVSAVAEASSAMVAMCAWAVLFSGLLSLVGRVGLPGLLARIPGVTPQAAQAFLAGLAEVTGGSVAAAALGGEAAIVAVSFCCSWGGLSVLFQVISCFRGDSRPGFGPLLVSRLAHGCLSAGIALPLYRHFCGETPAWAPAGPPALVLDGSTVAVALCLLGMCSMIALGQQSGRQAQSGQ